MHNPKTITVSDIMTKSVICIDSSMNINESAKMMEDAKVSALIVMENNSPVDRQIKGILLISNSLFFN